VSSNLAYVDSGTDLVFGYNASTQQFKLTAGTSTATSVTTVSAATWYVIDLRYDLSGTTHLGDWRVDGVAQTQVSRAATATTANGFGMGASANASVYTANYDDILVSNQSSEYPLGDGRIVRLVPDSMGTSSGATNFSNNDGTAIDATSWQRLDEVPMTSNADYIRQQANSASFLELGFQNTAETCIRDLSAVLAYHAAGTSADNGKTSIFDGATETVVFSGDMSQTALQYKRAIVTPAALSWTQAAVNGLVARVGYSTDSSPNPYWDAIVLEAAVSDVVSPPLQGVRIAAAGDIACDPASSFFNGGQGSGRRSDEGVLRLRPWRLARRRAQLELLRSRRLRCGLGAGAVAAGGPRRPPGRLHARLLAPPALLVGLARQ